MRKRVISTQRKIDPSKQFVSHKNLRLVVFSYLPGAIIYHKISILDHYTRRILPVSGLLDQIKILTMKASPKANQLKYALDIADIFHLVATQHSISAVNQLAEVIDLKNKYSSRQTLIDLTVKDLSKDQTQNLFSRDLDESLNVRKITAKESSSVVLLNRLRFTQFSSQDNKYMNDNLTEIVECNHRTYEEYIRCSLKPQSRLWKSNHPKCLQLKLCDSTDMLNIIQFDSLEELQYLQIDQPKLDSTALQKKISIIPSTELYSIEINTNQISLFVIEDLLDQMDQLKAQNTQLTIKTRKLKGFRVTAIANISELVQKDLQELFQYEFYQAGRQLQIKFKHRVSAKQLNLYTQDISCDE